MVHGTYSEPRSQTLRIRTALRRHYVYYIIHVRTRARKAKLTSAALQPRNPLVLMFRPPHDSRNSMLVYTSLLLVLEEAGLPVLCSVYGQSGTVCHPPVCFRRLQGVRRGGDWGGEGRAARIQQALLSNMGENLFTQVEPFPAPLSAKSVKLACMHVRIKPASPPPLP